MTACASPSGITPQGSKGVMTQRLGLTVGLLAITCLIASSEDAAGLDRYERMALLQPADKNAHSLRVKACQPFQKEIDESWKNPARVDEFCALNYAFPREAPARIFIGVSFGGELDMLELHMRTVGDYIEGFIAAEADHTHQGEKKPFHLDDPMVEQRLGPTLFSKLRVVQVKLPSEQCNGTCVCEKQQRNGILQGLPPDFSARDIMVVGDVDEILRPRTLVYLARCAVATPIVFHLRMHYYNLAVLDLNSWTSLKAISGYDLQQAGGALNADGIRHGSSFRTAVLDAGWHLSYFGGRKQVSRKLRSICDLGLAHQVHMVDIAERLYVAAVASGKDMFDRNHSQHDFNLIEDLECLDVPEPVNIFVHLCRYAAADNHQAFLCVRSEHSSHGNTSDGEQNRAAIRSLIERYIAHHRVERVRNSSTGIFIRSPYRADGVQVGNRMHEFLNAFAFAIVEDLPIFWAYADGHRAMEENLVLHRRAWIPSASDISPSFNDTTASVFFVTGWGIVGQETRRKRYMRDQLRSLACGASLKLQSLPHGLVRDGPVQVYLAANEWQQAALLAASDAELSSKAAAERARLLFSDGANVAFGMLFHSAFTFANNTVQLPTARALAAVNVSRAAAFKLGFHLRHQNASDNGTDINGVWSCLESMLLTHAQSRPCVVLLATDREGTTVSLEKIVHLFGCELIVMDRGEHQERGLTFEHGKFAGASAIRDIFLASQSDAFVGTAGSSFSQLIAELITSQRGDQVPLAWWDPIQKTCGTGSRSGAQLAPHSYPDSHVTMIESTKVGCENFNSDLPQNRAISKFNVDVAFIYFGLTRSTRLVWKSHFEALYQPLHRAGLSYRVYLHSWNVRGEIQKIWDSPSDVPVDSTEYLLLRPDVYRVTDVQQTFLENLTFSDYFNSSLWESRGDVTDGEWQPALLRNHLCALESMKRAYQLVLDDRALIQLPKHYVFVRPDVMFSSKLVVFDLLTAGANEMVVPLENWGEGYNDRFAIAGLRAATVYASRIDRMKLFRAKHGRIVSEKFLKWALDSKDVAVFEKGGLVRFDRVRPNGFVEPGMDYSLLFTSALQSHEVRSGFKVLDSVPPTARCNLQWQNTTTSPSVCALAHYADEQKQFRRLGNVSGVFLILSDMDACGLVQAAIHRGMIAGVRRGGCSFAKKAVAVQKAGFDALVIIDSDSSLMNPGLGWANVSIPVVMMLAASLSLDTSLRPTHISLFIERSRALVQLAPCSKDRGHLAGFSEPSAPYCGTMDSARKVVPWAPLVGDDPEERFLGYQRFYGQTSNRLLALANALAFARSLNRTLIYRADDYLCPLDLSRASRAFSIVDAKQVIALEPPSHYCILDETGSMNFCSAEGPSDSYCDSLPIDHTTILDHLSTEDELQRSALTSDSAAYVTMGVALHQYPFRDESQLAEIVGIVMPLDGWLDSQHHVGGGRTPDGSSSDYVCLHWRRGDFATFCKSLGASSSCYASAAYAAKKTWEAAHQQHHQPIRSVFIASNANASERADLETKLARMGLDVQPALTSDGDTDGATRPFRDQLMCSTATAAVLNRHSSFSSVIHLVRLARYPRRIARDTWL